MSLRITGLSPEPFVELYGLSEAALAERGVERVRADGPGYPDRIEVRDADPGERLLLLNWEHQPTPTPYRASHAIFVLEGATEAFDRVDDIPEAMRRRTLSLRAFDHDGCMVDAALAEEVALETSAERLLADGRAAYIHAHYAVRGCYAALIRRA